MSIRDIKVTCTNCSLDNICFPRGLTKEEIGNISQVIKAKNMLHRGDCLFHQGDDFRGVVAIKSGSAKLVADDHYGNEHILKVLLPGELLGFDGFHNGKYQCSAFALEALSFCILPAQSMNDLFQNHPALTRELFRHSSEKINQDKDFIVLSKQPAEEKMAHFLIALSDRMRKRGFSSSEFTLSLTRQEIGNHLGLAMETVSRLLKKFQQQELILVKSKFIVLKNIPKLRAVSIHSK